MKNSLTASFCAPKSLPLMNIELRQHNVTQERKKDHSSRIKRGIDREKVVFDLLTLHGRNCVKQIHQEHFDILADGWRLDVKTSAPTNDSLYGIRWLFNFHHQGTPVVGADFFVCRLESLTEGDPATHLLLPCPFQAKTIRISEGTLRTKYAPYARDFSRFLYGDFGLREIETSLPEAQNA